MNSICLGFLGLWGLSSQCRVHQALPSPCLCCILETLNAIGWGCFKLMLFPSYRDHYPSLSYVWCLQNHCFMYLVFFFCPEQEGNVIPVTLFWPWVKVTPMPLFFIVVKYTLYNIGHGVLRSLVKHYFWMCLWWYFCMKLAFEWENSAKQFALPSVSGHQSVHWGTE